MRAPGTGSNSSGGSTNPFADDYRNCDDVESTSDIIASGTGSSAVGIPTSSPPKGDNCSSDGVLHMLPMRSQDRKCTDALFFVLLVLAWLAMTVAGLQLLGVIKVSGWLHEGDPERLIRGIDYKGNLCSVGVMEGLDDIWLPNFVGTNVNSQGVLVPVGFGICVDSCPKKGAVVSDPYGEYGTWNAPSDCINVVSRCMPLDAKSSNKLFAAAIVFSDLLQVYSLIAVLGFVLAIILSFLFIKCIQIPYVLRIAVWLCVWVVVAILSAGCYSVLLVASDEESMANSADRQSSAEVAFLKSFGYLLGIFAVCWVSFILFMRDKIAFAIGVVRESATALTDMPGLSLFPFLQLFFFAAFTAIWILYSVYLASSGKLVIFKDETTGIQMRVFEYDQNAQITVVGFIFVWFWTIGFIEAVGSLVCSYAVVTWYFQPEADFDKVTDGVPESITVGSGTASSPQLKNTDSVYQGGNFSYHDFKNDMGEVYKILSGSEIVWNAVKCTFRYHLGTAAVGSFAIAILRTVRLTVFYVRLKLTSNRITGPTDPRKTSCRCCSSICAYMLSCVDCLLACIDKRVRFVNKHAYTQVAMFGDPFCRSARRGFSLIRKNFGRVATVHVIGDFVVLVGKLSIALTSAAISYVYIMKFDSHLKKNLHGYVIPILLVAFVSFFTATMVLGMLSIVCDSTMQSFIVDETLTKSSSGIGGVVVDLERSSPHTPSSSSSSPLASKGFNKHGRNSVRMDGYKQPTDVRMIGDDDDGGQAHDRESKVDYDSDRGGGRGDPSYYDANELSYIKDIKRVHIYTQLNQSERRGADRVGGGAAMSGATIEMPGLDIPRKNKI